MTGVQVYEGDGVDCPTFRFQERFANELSYLDVALEAVAEERFAGVMIPERVKWIGQAIQACEGKMVLGYVAGLRDIVKARTHDPRLHVRVALRCAHEAWQQAFDRGDFEGFPPAT
jgi:hypothetical protein